MKKVFCIAALVFVGLGFLALPILAFAGDGQGVAGSYIFDLLEKLLKDNTVAVSIYTAVIGLIGIGIRVLLKKIPGGADGMLAGLIWKLLVFLFGKGVVMSGNTDMEFVKKELQKEYPLLKIDIQKVADGTYK